MQTNNRVHVIYTSKNEQVKKVSRRAALPQEQTEDLAFPHSPGLHHYHA